MRSSAAPSLALCLLVSTYAHADTGTSAGDGGGEGGGPFAGLLQAPEANLFTGGVSQAIPIRIPPGRKMATPDLNLVYSSGGGGGGLIGEGWSMPLGSIERSTKWGVPRCTSSAGFNATDEFVLSLSGSAVELVNFGAGPSGSTVYRPRTDQSFLEALRKTDNTWEVFERSGMRYKLGTTAESRRTRSTACGFTAVWGLTEIKDPNNNTAAFTYLSGKDALVLDNVQYGGTPSNQAFQVRFEYIPNPHVMTSYRNGTLEKVVDLVNRIHVEAKTTEAGSFGPVRMYDLKYDHEYTPNPPSGCSALDRVLLCEVSVNDGLPAQSFEYAPAAFSLASTTSQSAPDSKQHLRSATMNADVEDSVMDMNGDGRLDFVDSANMEDHTWDLFYGLAAGGISPTLSTKWCASGSTLDGAHLRRETDFENGFARTQKETIDMNGDGLPDFVDSTVMPWKVHLGSLVPRTCETVSGQVPGFDVALVEWDTPEVESTLTQKDMNGDRIRSWKRLADMNADGRPDLVIADPTLPWEVYLNNGQDFVDVATAGATDMDFGTTLETRGPISEEVKTSGVRRTNRDLFDFNGDGLPDLVVGGSGSFLVYLNDGQTFYEPELSISALGAESAVRAVDNSNGETLADFIDLNGDGLPDRVSLIGSTWWVRLNLGTSLASETSWGALGPIRDNNSKGNTKIDLIDWNHDGMVDRVDAHTNTWQIRLGLPTTGPGIRPYLMTAAKNGVGGVTTPTYEPSTRFANTLLPFVSWLATATRRTDGLCTGTPTACLNSGNEIQRTYDYAEGYFDGPTREFRGFGRVTENFIHASGAALTSKRVVYFHQEDHKRGQIEMEETYADNAALIRRDTFSWLPRVDGPRTQIYLGEKKTEEFDIDGGGEPPQCRMDRNVEPDEWGRVATRCTLPCGTSAPGSCTANTIGKVTTVSAWADPSYTPGTQPAVRERPASVTVTYVKPDGSTSLPLSQQTFSYHWPTGNVLTATTTGDAVTDGNALVTTAYDGTYGNMTSVTDARGAQSTSGYTGTPFQLFPSTETNAAGHTVQTQWDLRYGKETQVIGPNGSANGDITVASYDLAGRVKCEAKPGQSCGGASPVPSAEYTYVLGNPSGSWEAKLSYAEVKTREPNNTTGTLPGYLLTRSYVDALGRERATATWRVIGSGNTLVWAVTKQVEYTSMGAAKRVHAPYQTGTAGTGPVGLAQSPSSASTLYGYGGVVDPTNRVRSVTSPDLTVVTTQYSAAWTHVIDPAPEYNKTSTQADFLGREKTRLLHQGSSSLLMQYDYTYDGLDRLLTTKVGGSGGTTVTSDWDLLGRKKQVVDPDSGTWDLRYDKNGNPTLQDDPKTGQRVEACYDKINRLALQCSYPSDSTTGATSCPLTGTPACGSGGTEIARYTYDTQPGDAECGGPGRIGQLTSVLDTSGGECFAYDNRGRVTVQKKTILHNAVSTTARTAFVYDQADHVTAVQYPDSNLVAHGYQPDGLPESIAQIISGAEYDLFGRATKITSFRNTEDLYGFDPTGSNNFRLQTIQTKQTSSGTLYLNLGHTYRPRGKLKEVIDYRDAGTARSNAAAYCYDGIGRLLQVDRDPTMGGNPCSSDESFTHNTLGNLTVKNGTPFAFAPGTHRPTSWGSTYPSISHDANGSRTFKDKGSGTKDEFVYDARGLLTQVKRWTTGSVTSSQTNLYDYAGTRVVKAPSSGAGTTIRTYNRYAEAGGGNLSKFYFLGDRMVASWTASAPSLSEVEPELLVPPPRLELPPELLFPAAGALLLLLFLPLGGTRRLGVRLSLARSASLSVVFVTASFPVVIFAGCGGDPVVRLFHVDRLGSTQVVTDWNGAIYRQMRYFAYGEIRGRFDAAGNPASAVEDARFEFTGYETDFAGLDYAGARFFDPELAQFGSHDPAGQYASPYAYGPGDPINGTDPGGELYFEIALALAAIIAAAVDAKHETGSNRAAFRAGLEASANLATGGIYGAVEAQSNDDIGAYLANYALNSVTLGAYGTVKAFNDGQVASGIVGVAAFALAAYGAYQSISSLLVSGNETAAKPLKDPPVQYAEGGNVATDAMAAPEVPLSGDGTLGDIPANGEDTLVADPLVRAGDEITLRAEVRAPSGVPSGQVIEPFQLRVNTGDVIHLRTGRLTTGSGAQPIHQLKIPGRPGTLTRITVRGFAGRGDIRSGVSVEIKFSVRKP